MTEPSQLSQLNGTLVWQGFRHLAPISLFVIVFGAAFGLAAVQLGLTEANVLAMSGLVFAGASQFAALDLWGDRIPLFTVMITVFAINARHLLMGATLYPWLRETSIGKRYALMVLASDANWALAMQHFHQKKPGFGMLVGGGLALWTAWMIGTGLGIYFGNAISDPKAYGLDMAMGCFLLALVVGGEKNVRIVTIWGVAAVASILAYLYLPENSHVIVGALAGGLVGLLPGGDDRDV